MSWLQDYYAGATKTFGDVGSWILDNLAVGPGAGNMSSLVSDFYKNQISAKASLRSSQFLEAMSGVPIVGSFIRGVQGVNQLEDLYNNTGRTSNYAGSGVSGASGIGSGLSTLGKIADGAHDLYQFYAGEPDDWGPMFG